MKRGATAAVIFGIAGVAMLPVLTIFWLAFFRVIVPLTEATGRVVLVDLGYVPEAAKDATARPAATVEVVGTLYWPDEVDSFIPAPDHAANIWFARDLMPMAEYSQ